VSVIVSAHVLLDICLDIIAETEKNNKAFNDQGFPLAALLALQKTNSSTSAVFRARLPVSQAS